MKLRLCSSIFFTMLAGTGIVPLAHAGTGRFVGSCTTKTPHYATITEAVAGAGDGDTIFVCPGRYSEQITITRPLTLLGVASGNASGAVLVSPPTGLVINAPGAGIAAQIAVMANGPVNLGNLTVDGADIPSVNGQPFEQTCNAVSSLAGIYYNQTPGSIQHVETRNYSGFNGCAGGIYLDTGHLRQGSVTVEYSTIHDYENYGVLAAGPANLRNNYVLLGRVKTQSEGSTSLGTTSGGTITNNFVDMNHAPAYSDGITTFTDQTQSVGTPLIEGNIVERGQVGIDVFLTGNQVKNNTLIDNVLGLVVSDDSSTGNTITDNFFVSANLIATGNYVRSGRPIGAELNCVPGNTFSGNTFFGLGIGMNDIAPTEDFSSTNNFYEVSRKQAGCIKANVPPASQPQTSLGELQ